MVFFGGAIGCSEIAFENAPSFSAISAALCTLDGKLCVMLILSQHVLKGFVFAYISTSLDFVFRLYAVTGPQIQIYKAVSLAPFTLKPLFGIMSDKLPIFGYHKTPYMLISSLAAIGALGYLGFVGWSHYQPSQGKDGDSLVNDRASPELKAALPLNFVVVCFFVGVAGVEQLRLFLLFILPSKCLSFQGDSGRQKKRFHGMKSLGRRDSMSFMEFS